MQVRKIVLEQDFTRGRTLPLLNKRNEELLSNSRSNKIQIKALRLNALDLSN